MRKLLYLPGSAGYSASISFHEGLGMFYREDRLAVMIDGVNLNGMLRALDFEIDFKALRDEFARRGRMTRISYHTPLPETDEHLPVRPLLDWLDYNGYTVVTRPAREYEDASGRRRLKGSANTSLVVDALDLSPHIDHLVLISGDGDFVPLVESLKRKGIRVTVISTIKSSPPMASDDLRRAADHFVDLDGWKEAIRKHRDAHRSVA